MELNRRTATPTHPSIHYITLKLQYRPDRTRFLLETTEFRHLDSPRPSPDDSYMDSTRPSPNDPYLVSTRPSLDDPYLDSTLP